MPLHSEDEDAWLNWNWNRTSWSNSYVFESKAVVGRHTEGNPYCVAVYGWIQTHKSIDLRIQILKYIYKHMSNQSVYASSPSAALTVTVGGPGPKMLRCVGRTPSGQASYAAAVLHELAVRRAR